MRSKRGFRRFSPAIEPRDKGVEAHGMHGHLKAPGKIGRTKSGFEAVSLKVGRAITDRSTIESQEAGAAAFGPPALERVGVEAKHSGGIARADALKRKIVGSHDWSTSEPPEWAQSN